MVNGISFIGFFVGIGAVMLGIFLGVVVRLTRLLTHTRYPLWGKISMWLLGGGAILTIVSFQTCFLTFKL